MSAGLRVLGIRVDETPDGATIHGGTIGSGSVESHGDHRIAMAFSVAAQRAAGASEDSPTWPTWPRRFPGYDALAQRAGFGAFTRA